MQLLKERFYFSCCDFTVNDVFVVCTSSHKHCLNLEGEVHHNARQVNSPCVHGLPLQDLLPGLLVVLVVDFDDVGHVIGGKLIVSPAPPAAESRSSFNTDHDAELRVLQPHVRFPQMSLKFLRCLAWTLK